MSLDELKALLAERDKAQAAFVAAYGTPTACAALDKFNVAETALNIEAGLALPALLNEVEALRADARRYRRIRGKSLRDVAAIFDPRDCRDGAEVMRRRDAAIDAMQEGKP